MPRGNRYKGIVWGDPPPRRSGQRGVWVERLKPLIKRPGHWAKVLTFDFHTQAQDAADNLKRRNVDIPNPQDDWTFMAREKDLYAIYHGKKGARARIR